jgi:hypothetical protein
VDWMYDWKTDTWISNSPDQKYPDDGGGIYFDETSRKWFVNIVFQNQLYLGRTYGSFKEAKEEAEKYFNELREEVAQHGEIS